jgi:glycosyltransferase involved in cell wall biosynthesis
MHKNGNNHTLKEFEIVIPSYNNVLWVEKNLNSVCFQSYPREKYHITYINDASTDGTGVAVAEYIKKHKLESLVTLINNSVRKGQLENRYRTFHSIDDQKIIAECDGDDFWVNDYVLKELNSIYQNPDVWMLYTSKHEIFPAHTIIQIHPFTHEEVAKNSFRNFWYRPTWQLRSYYAWLFKQVKLKDLLYEGLFYPVLTDPAYMIPMLELAGKHNKNVNKVLYVVNRTNPINTQKVYDKNFRKTVYKDISGKHPYQPINDLNAFNCKTTNEIPEVIICCSSTTCAERLSVRLQESLSIFNQYSVFLRNESRSLRQEVIAYLSIMQADYVVLITDENIGFIHHIDLQECIAALKDTGAIIFSLSLKLPKTAIFPCVQIKEHIWANQFKYGQRMWMTQEFLGAFVCSRKFLLNCLEQSGSSDMSNLNEALINNQILSDDVGLFFDESPIKKIGD